MSTKRIGVIAGTVLLLLASGSTGWAAGFGKILGTVKTEKGLPLAGADISVLAVKAPTKLVTVQSDAHGKFRIERLPAGDYAIKISQKGYEPIMRPPVKVAAGHSTPLHLILQLRELITQDPHPDNWDIRTALKAAPDRRMIFRADEGPGTGGAEGDVERASAVNTRLKNSALRVSTAVGDPYSDRAMSKPSLSFAYAPLTFLDSQYTVAAQWNPIENAAWKIKNTWDYRINDHQSLRLYSGYGKTGLFATKTARFHSPDPGLRDDFSLVQTFALGAENQTRISDFLTITYGLGYDQVRSFDTRAVVHPEIQLLLTPNTDWLVRGWVTSRREQEAATLRLPEGEAVHLNDPLDVVQAGRQVLFSGHHHYEIGVVRRLPGQSELSVSTYADRAIGRTPIVATVRRPDSQVRPRLFELNDHQADADGVRVTYSKHLCEALSGSVAYVYTTGAEAQKGSGLIPLSHEYLMDLNRRGSFHLVSTQIETSISKTRTRITTLVKWLPRKPLNTVDQFSDKWDVANGGVNLFIRQYLPLPVFLNLLSGWEAAVDVRNLIDQNNGLLVTSSGETVILKNPRSFRGGILFRF